MTKTTGTSILCINIMQSHHFLIIGYIYIYTYIHRNEFLEYYIENKCQQRTHSVCTQELSEKRHKLVWHNKYGTSKGL